VAAHVSTVLRQRAIRGCVFDYSDSHHKCAMRVPNATNANVFVTNTIRKDSVDA
jgi:hypothetical protein